MFVSSAPTYAQRSCGCTARQRSADPNDTDSRRCLLGTSYIFSVWSNDTLYRRWSSPAPTPNARPLTGKKWSVLVNTGVTAALVADSTHDNDHRCTTASSPPLAKRSSSLATLMHLTCGVARVGGVNDGGERQERSVKRVALQRTDVRREKHARTR